MRERLLFGGIVVSLSIAGGLLAFWIGDDTLPRIITRITPLNSPVTPGDTLRLEFEGDAIRNCPATVREQTVDAKNIVAQVDVRRGVINRSAGHFTASIEVPTSPTAAPGPARYKSTACYACNPLQRWRPICVEREVDFEFAPSPLSQMLARPRAVAAAEDAF